MVPVDVSLAKQWIRLLIKWNNISKEGGLIGALNLLHILKFDAKKYELSHVET